MAEAEMSSLLAVARGDRPADCVLANGRVVNTFSGEIESADIAIFAGRIAGVGKGYRGIEQIDLAGQYVSPGLIDAHVHIESSLCVPSQFAAAIVPRGTITVIADPHEIANVTGSDGVRYMAEASKNLPLSVHLMAPSCVPATPMASSGGMLSADELRKLRSDGLVIGLAEVMNFPGVMAGDRMVMEKIAVMNGRPIDGHCPGVVGHGLCAYTAAGIGSDHESVTVAEAKEKLARGLYVLIREATNARNLDALLPMITAANSRRICFCSDDRTPTDLLNVGSIDHMVRRAISYGIAPIEAIRMATLNPAEWFGMRDRGAIAPGRRADLFTFDDLACPMATLVFSGGKMVAKDGAMLGGAAAGLPAAPMSTCKVDWAKIRWDVPAQSSRMRVIGSLPDQLITENRVMAATTGGGKAVADVSRDILKMMVIERHHGRGTFGVGFIQGFGLKKGAIAGTVAHDHHNLVVIGTDDLSMQSAARAAAALGGGLTAAVGENVVASLALPVAGLMSDRPLAEVASGYAKVVSAAREFGSPLNDPFMAMSFMALEVIPALKLTDLGLVDVEQFKIVSLFV
jgi:adenine deaminase